MPDTSIIQTSLPLVDLHRHLEGSLRLSTVLELCLEHHLPLPGESLQELQRATWIHEPVRDIVTIFPKFDLLRQVFLDEAIIRRSVSEFMQDAAREGLSHVECRFSPYFMAELHGLTAMSVTGAVVEAWQEEHNRYPMTSSLIVILSRTYGAEICGQEMDCALAYCGRGVAGVDLAGDEMRQPARNFEHLFDRAHQAGLRVTAHAGEFAGTDSIRETLRCLRPARLGHAVRAADDPRLMDELAQAWVAVECCPTSNYLTGTIPSMQAHPLPTFLKHGICATLNTDDPSLMGDLTIQQEYRHAAEEMGLNTQQLAQVQINGGTAAFA